MLRANDVLFVNGRAPQSRLRPLWTHETWVCRWWTIQLETDSRESNQFAPQPPAMSREIPNIDNRIRQVMNKQRCYENQRRKLCKQLLEDQMVAHTSRHIHKLEWRCPYDCTNRRYFCEIAQILKRSFKSKLSIYVFNFDLCPQLWFV